MLNISQSYEEITYCKRNSYTYTGYYNSNEKKRHTDQSKKRNNQCTEFKTVINLKSHRDITSCKTGNNLPTTLVQTKEK